MSDWRPFKAVDGITIELNHTTATFRAVIDGKDIRANNARSIERKIIARRTSVSALVVANYGHAAGVRRVEVVGRHWRNDFAWADATGEQVTSYSEQLYEWDAGLLAKLTEIAERYRALGKEWQETLRTAPIFTQATIDRHNANHQTEEE